MVTVPLAVAKLVQYVDDGRGVGPRIVGPSVAGEIAQVHQQRAATEQGDAHDRDGTTHRTAS
jgi:hypothetical protein